MKNSKILTFFGGAVSYIALALLLSGYGNKQNHPSINGYIVDAFVAKNNKGEFSMAKFKQYMFHLDVESFRGDGITKEGLFHPGNSPAPGNFPISYFEEGKMELTAKGWIKHGGMSADVPEVPASLRHFYDPTEGPGGRYLKDKVNGRLLGFAQSLTPNPHIDHEEWAIGKPGGLGTEEHNYTWENGKLWMKGALEESDPSRRKELMAKAWRALGETLHYIADNGCPSHVRDDAHPSPFWDYNDIFGNPDPYEEYMAIIEKENGAEFSNFKTNNPDQDLVTKFRDMKTAKAIAHELAVWTNRNFLTTETISGTDWKGNAITPITHPEKTYPSPSLGNMNYSQYYYKSMVGGYEVKHCTDLSYVAKLIPVRCYPYVDKECVKSQAAVLIPNIVEAGMNVLKLYIPAMTVEITEAKDGVVKGKVKHTTDEEYTTSINYKGKVKVTIKGSNFSIKKEVECDAVNGAFEAVDLQFATGDLAYAEISFGGVIVESKEFNCSGESDKILETALKTKILSQGLEGIAAKIESKYLSNGEVTSNSTNNEDISFSIGSVDFNQRAIQWNGTSFSVTIDTVDYNYTKKITLSGSISSDGKVLKNLSWNYSLKKDNSSTGSDGVLRVEQDELTRTIELVNVPLNSWVLNYGVFYEKNGTDVKPMISKLSYQRRFFNSSTYQSKTTSTESIEKIISFDIKADARLYCSFWQ